MKNSKLKITTASIAVAAAVMGTTSATQIAHADDVTPDTPDTAKATQASTTQTPVTQQDVDKAKSDVDTAQKNTDTSDNAVSNAKGNSDKASTVVTETKTDLDTAETVNADTTPEKVEKADSDVKAAENTVTDVKTNVDKAQSDSASAQADNEKAQANADNAQKASDKATTDAQTAASNVDKAQTDATNAKTQVTADEKAVTDAQAAVDTKQKAVDDAKIKADNAASTDQKAEKAKETAKNELTNAENAKAQTETDKNAAQKNVDDQQKVVDNAAKATQAAKDELAKQSDSTYPQVLDLSPEWIKAFNEFKNAKGTSDETAKRNALDALTNSESSRLHNAFTSQTTLSKDKSNDINNLDSEMANKLNQYLISLLNSIHKALNDGQTVQANSNLIQFASDVAAQYQAHKNGIESGHDIQALNAAAKKNGLVETAGNPYENLLTTEQSYYGESTTYQKVSEHELYRLVYDTTIYMFAGDGQSKYAHALALLNSNTLGMSFNSYLKDEALSQEVHILNVPNANYMVKSGTTSEIKAKYENLYGKNSSANLKESTIDTTKLQAILDKAIENETVTNKQLASLKVVLQNAVDALTVAQQNVQIAQAKYDALVNAPTASNQAQKELAEAKTALSNAQTELATAQSKLAASKDALADKLASLTNAQNAQIKADNAKTQKEAELATAKNVLADATDKANASDEKLATARKELETAHTALSAARVVLEALKSSQSNYEIALDAYNNALAKQAIAETAYNNAVQHAKEAHVQMEAANTTYNQIYSQYLLQLAIDKDKEKGNSNNGKDKDKDKDKGKTNHIVNPTKPHIDGEKVTATTTKVNTPVKFEVAEKRNISDKPALTTPTNNEMPKAGEKDSPLVALFGMLLVASMTMLGFKRKKQQ